MRRAFCAPFSVAARIVGQTFPPPCRRAGELSDVFSQPMLGQSSRRNPHRFRDAVSAGGASPVYLVRQPDRSFAPLAGRPYMLPVAFAGTVIKPTRFRPSRSIKPHQLGRAFLGNCF